MARKEEIIQKAQELAKKAKPVAEHMPMSAIIAACVDMAEWTLNNLWHDASDPHDESKLLIVKLISGQVALYRGSFNNAERDFGIIEATEHGSEPKGIIEEWCYFDDILPDNK